MLSYMYKGTYKNCTAQRGQRSTLEFTVLVYALADKYDISRLRDYAAESFDNNCDPVADSAGFIAALQTMETHVNPKDDRLRKIVIPAIQHNIGWLLELDTFKAAIDASPTLKWELMGLLGKSSQRRTGQGSPIGYGLNGRGSYGRSGQFSRSANRAFARKESRDF